MENTQGTLAIADAAPTLFGEILVEKGFLTFEELDEALDEQRRNGGRLGEILLRLKKMTDVDIAGIIAKQFSSEYVSLEDVSNIDLNVARILPESMAKRFCLAAIGKEDDNIVIARPKAEAISHTKPRR